MEILLTVLVVVVCVAVEAFFSGSEIAVISADRMKLRHAAASGSRGAALALKMLDKPEWLLSTTLTGTNVALVVNTTSQGMVGQSELDLQLDRLPKTALPADIIYTPLESPFLTQARERGHATVGGLGMLLHQGPPAWKLWFDVEPTVTEELRDRMERSIAGT